MRRLRSCWIGWGEFAWMDGIDGMVGLLDMGRVPPLSFRHFPRSHRIAGPLTLREGGGPSLPPLR